MCGSGRESHDIEQAERADFMDALYASLLDITRWHGALQAKFERDLFGATLTELLTQKSPPTVMVDGLVNA
jgi:hypothetical protein